MAKTAQDGGSPARLDETNESAANQANRLPGHGGDGATVEAGAKLENLTNAVADDQIIKRQDMYSISNSVPETN